MIFLTDGGELSLALLSLRKRVDGSLGFCLARRERRRDSKFNAYLPTGSFLKIEEQLFTGNAFDASCAGAALRFLLVCLRNMKPSLDFLCSLRNHPSSRKTITFVNKRQCASFNFVAQVVLGRTEKRDRPTSCCCCSASAVTVALLLL